MNKRYLTKEERERCCELYMQGVPVQEIADEFGIAKTTVSNIALTSGLTLRHPKSSSPRKCHNCGEPVKKGFRFCPYCGKDIRSEKEILTEDLKSILGSITLLPDGERDRARNTINKAISYIGGAR